MESTEQIKRKRWHERSGWRIFLGMVLMKLATWPTDMSALEWFLLNRAELASGLALAFGLTTGGTSYGASAPAGGEPKRPAPPPTPSNPPQPGGPNPPVQ